MHFQLNRNVPSAIRPIGGTVWLVEIWQASGRLNGRWFNHVLKARHRLTASTEREAKRKVAAGLGLSESQFCGVAPEYFLRGAPGIRR